VGVFYFDFIIFTAFTYTTKWAHLVLIVVSYNHFTLEKKLYMGIEEPIIRGRI
jgi:hypothetical protein